jgi:hypothetical protein
MPLASRVKVEHRPALLDRLARHARLLTRAMRLTFLPLAVYAGVHLSRSRDLLALHLGGWR